VDDSADEYATCNCNEDYEGSNCVKANRHMTVWLVLGGIAATGIIALIIYIIRVRVQTRHDTGEVYEPLYDAEAS
jgi:hypothetical protein